MSKLFEFPSHKQADMRATREMLKVQHSNWFHCVTFSLLSLVNALKLYYRAFTPIRIYVLTCNIIRIHHFLDHEVVLCVFRQIDFRCSSQCTLTSQMTNIQQSFFNYLIAQCFLAPDSRKLCFNLMPNPQPAHNST